MSFYEVNILNACNNFVYNLCNFVLKTDFAMVAKLGQVKNAKKSELRQALRTKVNSMKFSASNPGYFVGKIHMATFT